MTTTTNEFKTADIKLSKDSVGYYDATHKYQGTLYEMCGFETRKEAYHAAADELKRIKENGINDYDETYD